MTGEARQRSDADRAKLRAFVKRVNGVHPRELQRYSTHYMTLKEDEVPKALEYAERLEDLFQKTCLSARGHAMVHALLFGYQVASEDYEEAQYHLYQAYYWAMLVGLDQMGEVVQSHLWIAGHLLE